MGNSSQQEKSGNGKRHKFLPFGQVILTEQQISRSALENQSSPEKSSTAGFLWNRDYRTTQLSLDTGHCKVFLESDNVGQTLDVSVLGSYEELYRKLANMFGVESSEKLGHVLYQDATGAFKQIGDEPFSAFTKTAKRLTIRMDSDNAIVGRSRLTVIRTTENGLEGPNERRPSSIFA
ncbi:hypothetical protein F3Y22_tig00001644pilonHSYRG00134 [Hibiscus syriacus]|uniref:PB1 domain-containing protein n=1 Tax=Hibiscus syriacus TaxID=106335 RepID=A0A6A3D0N4_HIBSY|nr:hypothetical protein F3Y22_tig00001644pilonHSYRG00134 [Hibiscus syriacus]